jgi:hypothetical protein
MRVTDEMVKASMAVEPDIPESSIRAVLAAALSGNVVFAVGEGRTEVAGKSRYPSGGTVLVRSPYKALELGQELIKGASSALQQNKTQCDIQLYLAGTATVELDD